MRPILKNHELKLSRKFIYNLLSYDLTQTEMSLLLKDLNFSLRRQMLKFVNHLLPFELLYKDVINGEKKNHDELIDLKTKIKDVGLPYFRLYNEKKNRFENLTEDEYKAFLNLTSNEYKIIQKADKANSVVVNDRLTYVHKME